MKKKPSAILLCVFSLLFLVFAPGMLGDALNRDVYRQFLSIEEPVWKGVLTVLHVNGSSGRGGAYLTKRAAAFEKSNFGVFINVESVNQTGFAARMLQEPKPDIVSYPMDMDWDTAQCARSVVPENLKPSLRAALGNTEATPHLPFMQSGYMMLFNADIWLMHGISQPSMEGYDAFELETVLQTLKAAQLNTLAVEKNGNLCALPSLYYNATEDLELQTTLRMLDVFREAETGIIEDGVNAFQQGEASMLLCTRETMQTLKGLLDAGKCPAFHAMAMPYYTDNIQCIAIMPSVEANKLTVCGGFVKNLYVKNAQKALSEYGALPVIPMDEQLYIGGEDGMLEEGLSEFFAAPLIRNWPQKSADVQALYLRALNNDDDAVKRIKRNGGGL